MPVLSAFGLSGHAASQGLFGANVLATRGGLEQDGAYDRLIEELGVGSFRYPGGSLTERYFDITDPNARIVFDRDTGEARDFIPLDEALGYAQAEGLSVTIVIPTRHLLSETVDANGDRFAAIDEDALRGFVRDVVNGVHGAAEIEAFELGNEYWGSGQMSSVEYGRLASEMAVTINDELDAQGSDAGIIVQSGTNFNFARLSDQYGDDLSGPEILDALNGQYGLDLDADSLFGSGEVNWTHVANELILSEFDTTSEREAVDAVASHVYSKAQAGGPRDFFLDQADAAWAEVMPHAGMVVTEWNTAGNSASLDRFTDYGLYQSHEMLNIVEEFMAHGVETAHVWPLIQNSPNTLSFDDGDAALTPAGQMFDLLQDLLPGKTAIDMTPGEGGATEQEEGNLAVHGFWEPGELLFYVAATGPVGEDAAVDLSGLVADPGQVSISVLRVADGQAAGSGRSDPQVDRLETETVLDGLMLSVPLQEGEILQMRMTDFAPSLEFQDVISEDAPDALPEPMIDAQAGSGSDAPLPTIPFDEAAAEVVAAEEEGEGDDDGGVDDGGLGDLALALPFLALLALFV